MKIKYLTIMLIVFMGVPVKAIEVFEDADIAKLTSAKISLREETLEFFRKNYFVEVDSESSSEDKVLVALCGKFDDPRRRKLLNRIRKISGAGNQFVVETRGRDRLMVSRMHVSSSWDLIACFSLSFDESGKIARKLREAFLIPRQNAQIGGDLGFMNRWGGVVCKPNVKVQPAEGEPDN